MRPLPSPLPIAALLAVVAVSSPAHAGNAEHPRTPVEWEDVSCMQFVDRSVDPVYTFAYAIPYEDTDVTAEEVADSRTHQFFALCQQSPPDTPLPGWITTADVEAAQANYPELATPAQADILEHATQWEGCWHRITDDAARRPITEALASMPVQWDTSSHPPGDYMLWGYTHEPIFNLWAPRAGGVVRVHDGGDPAQAGPAAAITTDEQTPCVGDTITLEGCVNALPGTTMTASFAITSGPNASDWTPFAQDVPVDGDSFALQWQAPEEAGGASAMLRATFTDPNGATYTAYQYAFNVVLAAEVCAPVDDDCMGGFVMDPACETSSGGSTTAAEDTDATDPGGAERGCDCRSAGDAGGAWGILGLVLLCGPWRRNRAVTM